MIVIRLPQVFCGPFRLLIGWEIDLRKVARTSVQLSEGPDPYLTPTEFLVDHGAHPSLENGLFWLDHGVGVDSYT